MMADVKTITHPILGTLVPAQAPLATYLSDEDDFDLSLYVEGDNMVIKMELDWPSRFNPGTLIEVTKELAVVGNFLALRGRGATVNEFERVFDKVAVDQLEFVGLAKKVEIRNSISKLMEEYFERLNAGIFDASA